MREKIKAIYANKSYRVILDIALFILLTYTLHKLWWRFDGWIYSIPMVDHLTGWMSHQVFLWSSWFDLHILGLDIYRADPNIIYFTDQSLRGIQITNDCSGFKQMVQLFMLFLLFPGPWKHKTWFIPMGLFLMFLTNVFRIIFLSVCMIWLTEYWDFIHMWVARPFYYIVLFVLWVIWVQKFRERKFNTSA